MWAKQCFNGINVGIDHPSNHHFFWGGLFTIPSHGWFMAFFYPHEVKRIKQWNYTRAQNPTFCASKSSSKSGSCRKMAVMPQSSHWKMENRIVSCIYIYIMITMDFLQWVLLSWLSNVIYVCHWIYHVLYRWDQQLGPIYVHSPDARIQIVGSVFYRKNSSP